MKVFDLHCDTLSELRRAEMRGDGQTFAHNNGHIDLEKLEKGDYMLQCFAAFVNLADPTPGADPLVTALEEIDVFKRMMERYSDRIAPVYRPEDIRKNAEAGKISGMLTIEEAGCCKGSLGVLRRMYELGVRMMTLTWNHENELASPNVVPGNGPIWPCMPNTETGLKEKGFIFTYDDAVAAYLANKSYSLTYGARNLRRTIQKELEDVIATRIIDSYDHPVTQLRAVMKDGAIDLLSL